MPCCPPPLLGVGPRLRSFLRDYDALQSLALALIYLQIGCALIGSLGALFNGVLVINLVIGLFAVVAIESSSQRLGRTYAVLLFFAVVLDVAWFILFSHAIWPNIQEVLRAVREEGSLWCIAGAKKLRELMVTAPLLGT